MRISWYINYQNLLIFSLFTNLDCFEIAVLMFHKIGSYCFTRGQISLNTFRPDHFSKLYSDRLQLELVWWWRWLWRMIILNVFHIHISLIMSSIISSLNIDLCAYWESCDEMLNQDSATLWLRKVYTPFRKAEVLEESTNIQTLQIQMNSRVKRLQISTL